MLLPNYDELVSLKNRQGKVEISAKAKAQSNTLGNHASLFKGRGLDFSECREYAPGDDIRAIDWRVTARMGRAHTKIFAEEREKSVFVIVDINDYMDFGTRKTFKSIQAARAAALVAWRANQLKDRTGAILFGHIPERVKVLKAKRSRKAIWQMLKTLCTEGTLKDEVTIADALATANRAILSGSSVFVISDFLNLSPAFEKELSLLSKRCDVTLVKINDPADKFLPHADEIYFSGVDGSKELVNTNDICGGELYQKLWIQNEIALSDLAHKSRCKVISLTTESDVSRDLFLSKKPEQRTKNL